MLDLAAYKKMLKLKRLGAPVFIRKRAKGSQGLQRDHKVAKVAIAYFLGSL